MQTLAWIRRVTVLAALVSLVSTVTGPSATAQVQNELGLEIRATPDGIALDSLAIELGTTDAGTTVFWLARTDTTPVDQAELSATPVEQVELQASVPGAAIELTVSGLETDGTFTVPPVRQVNVAVSGVSEPGTYEGEIYALQGDEIVTTAMESTAEELVKVRLSTEQLLPQIQPGQ